MLTVTYEYTGSIDTYTIPPGVTSVKIKAYGAQGGRSDIPAGLGASAQGYFSVNPGDVISILVGQSPVEASGGGGGSFVWRGKWPDDPVSLTNIMVAAGGGGGGTNNWYYDYSSGGGGGGGSFVNSTVNVDLKEGVRTGNGLVEISFPIITIKKTVSIDDGSTWLDADIPPGLYVITGTNPKFRISVANTGNETLTNIQIFDDVFGLIDTVPILAPGESANWEITGSWALGHHVNTATASVDSNGQIVTLGSDSAYWYGVESPIPAIDIIKEISPDTGLTWFHADTPPGIDIFYPARPQFRFIVTNIGNLTLTNVRVTDDIFGTVGTIASFTPGEARTFGPISVPWLSEGHINIAAATGEFEGIEVTATDQAYWFGIKLAIDVEGEILCGSVWIDSDAPPGPCMLIGTYRPFRVTVTNTSNVPLKDIVVSDSWYNFGWIVPSLAPGASTTFEHSVGTSWGPAQISHTAYATGYYPGKAISDTDETYVTVVDTPTASITLKKQVSPDSGVTWHDADTAPGPYVSIGSKLQYRLIIVNTGTSVLNNIIVTDGTETIGTIASLNPEDSEIIGPIIRIALTGQQVNTATAVSDGGTLDTDKAYYSGTLPLINIKKEVSPDGGVTWLEAEAPPGPDVIAGTNPQFRFTVTNTGTVTLSYVLITDDAFGIIGQIETLSPGASQTWGGFTETWASGQHSAIAKAIGYFEGNHYSNTDSSYWFGTAPVPVIEVKKEFSPDNGVTWIHANTPPGPYFAPGTKLLVSFVVTNSGTVTLDSVTVNDNVYGLIGTLTELSPGVSVPFGPFNDIVQPGQHINLATAEGFYADQKYTSNDMAYWFGAGISVPVFTITKSVAVTKGITLKKANIPSMKTKAGPNKTTSTKPYKKNRKRKSH